MDGNTGPFPKHLRKLSSPRRVASKQQRDRYLSVSPFRHSGSLPPRKEVASLSAGSQEQLKPGHCCAVGSTGARLMPSQRWPPAPSVIAALPGFGADEVLSGGGIILQRSMSLCLAPHGDSREEEEQRGRGEAGCRGPRVRGSHGGGWRPLGGQTQQAGTLTAPRKHEDNFQQTECKENWILQPLTLLLGPL